MTNGHESMKRCQVAISELVVEVRRSAAVTLLGWVLKVTPGSDIHTMIAIGRMLEAMDKDIGAPSGRFTSMLASKLAER